MKRTTYSPHSWPNLAGVAAPQARSAPRRLEKRHLNLVLLLSLCAAALVGAVGCKKGEPVLAKVNGEEIKQSQFDAYMAVKHIAAEDEKRRAAALDEYLKREGLAAVLEKEGKLNLSKIDAEVREYRKELIISRYFDEFLADSVTEEKVEGQYSADSKQFESKKVHAAHILLRADTRMSEEQRQAKLTTAQELYNKLQKGENFEELAKNYSEDKVSGSRGGDLGWIKEGTIDDRFSKRAFELKAGTFTEPFETSFGFHILKVLEEPRTVRRPLGAVAGEIRYRLRNEARDAEMKRLEGLIKISKGQSYDPKLRPQEPEVSARRPTAPSGSVAEGSPAPSPPGAPGASSSVASQAAPGAPMAPVAPAAPSGPGSAPPAPSGSPAPAGSPQAIAPAPAGVPKAVAPTSGTRPASIAPPKPAAPEAVAPSPAGQGSSAPAPGEAPSPAVPPVAQPE